MDLEVRHLRAICAIADAGSITKAALHLGLSQPTLSAQLRRLERTLGGELFVRCREGAFATALGEFVVAKARSVLLSIDAISVQVALHVGASGHRPLRYVATDGPLMVGLLAELKDLLPGTTPTLRTESHVATVIELIASGQQDLAAVVEYVGHAAVLPPDVRTATVATEPAFVLLPESHPMADRPAVRLTELAGEPWVLQPSRGNGLFEAFTQACAQAGFTPIVRYEAGASAARELIAAGQAVSLGQATFRSTIGVVPKPLVGTPLWIRHALLWHRAGALVELASAVAQCAERVYATAVRRSPHYLAWLADPSR
ncbi:hypothetical protein ACZ90_30370 [Streptomyces albus subsp. albus]|nr:hypothetical protein ACZ90_30370 [Streptomyces albus subsp. albus]